MLKISSLKQLPGRLRKVLNRNRKPCTKVVKELRPGKLTTYITRYNDSAETQTRRASLQIR